MNRQIKLVHWGLATALVVLLSSCGGGGGGGGSRGANGGPSPTPIPTLAPGENTPTPTTTPLRAVSNRNERTESSDAGSITLRVQQIDILGGQSTAFSVFLTDPSGHPVVGDQLEIETGVGLQVLSPEGGVGTTRADGTLSGTVRGIFGGTFALTITDTTDNSSLRGLSVTLTIVVNAPSGLTPTQTGGTQASVTPTPLPCQDVQSIIVQTDTFNVSGQVGGHPVITAEVFDSNNFPVSQVNVLFDVQPRIAAFDQITQITDAHGQASTRLTIPANSTVGTLTISAFACNRTGTVDINVVSGVSTKPVKSVVLQADPATVGTVSGGTVTLTAEVVDADNVPINGIDVLFITTLGKVNPLIDRTKVSGAQGGIATSVLQVPIGAVEDRYTLTVLAGGITGTTTIRVIPGRGLPGGINPGVPPGEPAGITLGANPTRIQVSGTGGTDLATIIGRVIDNNGNPLSNVRVHYHVVAAQSAPGAIILPVTPSGTPTPVVTTQCAPDDPVAVSDNAGFAVIQVRSGTQPGPVTVSACTDTTIDGVPKPLIEQQALVAVTSGPVNRIHLTINNVFIDNNDGSLTTTVSSIVTDAQGNTVEDGTPVFFEVLARKVCIGGVDDGKQCSSSGDCADGSCIDDVTDSSLNIAVSSDATTNALPTCDISQFIVQTGIPISPQPGDAITCLKFPADQQASEVTVRASVGGVFNNLAGQTLTLPGRISDLEVNVNPQTVHVSNGADALALVRASVLDANLDGIPNVRVRFSTSVGSIDRSVLSDENGDAIATLIIPAGTPSGTATLRIAAGGLQIPNVQLPSLTVSIINTGGGGTTPTPSTGAQPAAIQFIGAAPAVIGVRGSGLPEQSTLTFQVTDSTGAPVPGVEVNFSLARIADERISPLHATTDDQGKAQVTVASGRRALSVQVTAQVDTPGGTLLVRSTVVTILGGPPSQPNFSLAHQFNNISGRVTFGLTNINTAFVADRFGNPVPPGTAVSFTTKGGAIGNPTTTNSLGQAMATLVSQQPVPDNGTVVSLATTVGERPFIDTNGNGVCDEGVDPLLAVPEPFYDVNCNGVHDPGEDFIDTNGDGQFNPDQADLNQTAGGPKCSDQILVFEPICSTFSAGTSLVLIPSSTGQLPAGGSRDYTLIISDNPDPIGNPGVGNPLVGGSRVAVSIDGSRAKALGIGSFILPDAFTNDQIVDGINRFHFTVVDNAPASTQAEADAVVVTITSEGLAAGGNGSASISSVISFASAPSPTPTGTAVATATPQPPAIVPMQAALSQGTGAPPNGCNGSTQTFVVTGGSAPFAVFAGGGCVSVTSVPTSAGSFVFTAGNTQGDFTITVTDAAGKTASAGVRVQGPATAPPTLTPTDTPPPPATSTPTVTHTPMAPRSIVFISAEPASIGVKGSGLPEQASLTFRVTDALAQPIANIPVHFSLLSLGGETIAPIDAPTDDNGFVTTVLSSGNRATAVRVTASVAAFPSVTTQSTAVNIVGGEPAANRFSIAAQFRNIAGRVTFGLRDVISVFANDRFGNSVLPGTAVNFQSDGGSLVDITSTSAQGVAMATLVSDGQVPSNGVVTVLAYTRGEKAFTDLNGNGVPDPGEPVAPLPEPFFDKNGNGTRDANEPFIDVNNDGVWNADQEPAGQFSNQVLVFANARVTFSGATVALMDPSSFMIEDGGSAPVSLLLSDDLNNPLVSGTKVDIATSAGVKLRGIPASFVLGDTETFATFADGVNRFRFFIDDEKPGDGDVPQQITVTVTVTSPPSTTAPGGNGNATAFNNGVLLPRPTPTPQTTPTATATGATSGTPNAPTPTPPPPVGSIQFILFPSPTQIGVRQSGRPEQSILTFKVTDPAANPLAGVHVKFSLTGEGDETLNPIEAISDGFGFARTTVTSGTRAGSVSVTASADANGDGTPDLFAQSTAVAVVGGPPVSGRVSLGSQKRNFPGRVLIGQSVEVTALFNDRFGNAVPEGTAVTFITNGGAILGQIPTGPGGAATALLTAEAPFTSTGVATVMAYTRGEEAFQDNNGNGVFDAATDTITGDNTPEPFIDFRPLPPTDAGCTVPAPSPVCNNAFDTNVPFELFVDTGTKDGIWDAQGTPGVWDTNILVFGKVSVTMSGPLSAPVVTPNTFDIPKGGFQDFTLDIADDLGNPLSLGSQISVRAGFFDLELNTGGEQSFNQKIDGITRFHFTVTNPSVIVGGPTPVNMTVSIVSDNGSGQFTVGSGILE